ncbi:MAG: hypothetical protein RH862_05530 [Leptospiraceae bacterium]
MSFRLLEAMRKRRILIAITVGLQIGFIGCESAQRPCLKNDRQILPLAGYSEASGCEPSRLYDEARIKPPFDLPARKAYLLLDDSIDSSILMLRYEDAIVPESWPDTVKSSLKINESWSQKWAYEMQEDWPEARAHFNKNYRPSWWQVRSGDRGSLCFVRATSSTTRQRGILLFFESRSASMCDTGSDKVSLEYDPVRNLYLFYWNFQHWTSQ